MEDAGFNQASFSRDWEARRLGSLYHKTKQKDKNKFYEKTHLTNFSFTTSAYHLNGIFGNNFSTNGTGRSAPEENGKEMNCTICESFSNAEKVWVQTNMAANVSLGLQDS